MNHANQVRMIELQDRVIRRDHAVLGDVRRVIGERLQQHRDNLALWESGYLNPTERSEDERIIFKRELKAAIAALEEVNAVMGWAKV